MFNCGNTQIDTNRELILCLYKSNAPGRLHTSKSPSVSEYAQINEALYDWYALAASKNIFPIDPQLASKLSHNHSEVHCNVIIFMLCHCVVDYSDIQ